MGGGRRWRNNEQWCPISRALNGNYVAGLSPGTLPQKGGLLPLQYVTMVAERRFLLRSYSSGGSNEDSARCAMLMGRRQMRQRRIAGQKAGCCGCLPVSHALSISRQPHRPSREKSAPANRTELHSSDTPVHTAPNHLHKVLRTPLAAGALLANFLPPLLGPGGVSDMQFHP